MKEIIEKISWMPYNIIYNRESKKQNPIKLNLRGVGVKKNIIFHVIDNDEGLSKQLRLFGFREPLNWKKYYYFVDEEDVVLDVGANIGLFSILSENAKKIICVEPLKEAIPILRKNIKRNNLDKKAKIINAAVGKKGKLIIQVNGSLNLSRIVNNKTDNSYEIKSFNLGDLVKRYKSNTLRLDVEGYEYQILYKKIPKKVNKISLEFHTRLLGNEKAKKLLDYFEKENFRIRYLIEDLPLRLYPFFRILNKTDMIKLFTYVKEDISYRKSWNLINKGRAQKYLFLERKWKK